MSEYETKMKTLSKKLTRLGNDIAAICDKGRKAFTNPELVDLFFGMYTSLAKCYDRFEETWDEMHSLSDKQGGATAFPDQSEEALYSNVKRYFYDANTSYIKLSESKKETPKNPRVSSDVTISSNESSIANLPKLSIPPFDGNIMNWPKFKDVFCAIIHDDPSIPPVRKFHYLVRAVSGSAATIVTKVPLTADNYSIAWDELLKTFDKKRLLANAYLNELISFRPIQGKSNSISLQSFLAKVCENVSALQKLGIPDLGSFVLFHLSVKCLDQQSREAFETQCTEEFPKFDTLRDFVRNRQLALQLAENSQIDPTSKPKEERKDKLGKSGSKTQTTLLSNNDVGNSKPTNSKIVCVVCKQNHTILNCLPFLEANANQRIAWLRSWKGCRNCLSYNHVTDACQSKWSCRFCPSKHHSYLHVSTSKPVSPQSSNTESSQNSPSVNCCAVSHLESKVLLGTVVLEIEDKFGNFHRLRMVIDSGSQNTFLTQKCVDRLHLDQIKFSKKVSCLCNTSFS